MPVRLDRILTYSVPESLDGRIGIGARVKVRLGPRLTDAVVCETDVTPDIDPRRIHEIAGLDEGLERITPEEIRLWQFISDYYLCTQGEVFKCAYPSGKIRSEETAARVRERAEASRLKLQEAARERVAKLEAEIEASPAAYNNVVVIGTTGKNTTFVYGIEVRLAKEDDPAAALPEAAEAGDPGPEAGEPEPEAAEEAPGESEVYEEEYEEGGDGDEEVSGGA